MFSPWTLVRPTIGGSPRLTNSYLPVCVACQQGVRRALARRRYIPGILDAANRIASRATFSWISPLSSKMILFTGTRAAQYSNEPFPLPIRISLPLSYTPILAVTRVNSRYLSPRRRCRMVSAPSANAEAGTRLSWSDMRRPHSPHTMVVPREEPPVGTRGRPLRDFVLWPRLGNSQLAREEVVENCRNGETLVGGVVCVAEGRRGRVRRESE